jgi:hypothetical protein
MSAIADLLLLLATILAGVPGNAPEAAPVPHTLVTVEAAGPACWASEEAETD